MIWKEIYSHCFPVILSTIKEDRAIMVSVKYIINDEIIFDVNLSELQSLSNKEESISMNAPTARCLQLLMESNGQVVSRDEFLDKVWRSRGVVVSQNTFYQNISLLRKCLVRMGLSEDIIVTVRQKGFTLSPAYSIKMISETKEYNRNNSLDELVRAEIELPENTPITLENNDITQQKNKITVPRWLLIVLVITLLLNFIMLLVFFRT